MECTSLALPAAQVNLKICIHSLFLGSFEPVDKIWKKAYLGTHDFLQKEKESGDPGAPASEKEFFFSKSAAILSAYRA
jgi:hypothetical protein